VWKVSESIPSQFKSNTEKLAPVAFTIKGLDQGWMAQHQFAVTGWGIMFICSMILKTQLEYAPVTTDLTTTVVQSFKLLMNDFNPVDSHTLLEKFKTDHDYS